MRIRDWSSDVCSSDLLAGLDARAAGQAQLVVAHGRVEALAQQDVQDFVAHLLAEALLDDLRRHLAGAETLDPGRARDLAQAPADLVLQALRRQAERQDRKSVVWGKSVSVRVDV